MLNLSLRSVSKTFDHFFTVYCFVFHWSSLCMLQINLWILFNSLFFVLLQSNHFLKTDGKHWSHTHITDVFNCLCMKPHEPTTLFPLCIVWERFPPSYFKSPWTQTLPPTRLLSLLTADQPSRLCVLKKRRFTKQKWIHELWWKNRGLEQFVQ